MSLLAFGVFLSPSYAVAAEVALITIDPQSGSSIEKVVNDSDVPLESAQNLVDVINVLFSARSEESEDYYKYFGVEPESPSSIGVNAGKSAFLANCRIVLGEDWGKATLSIRAGSSVVWKLDSTGDYVTYAVMVSVKNSKRFRSGILQFRTETIKPTQKDKPMEISFRPSRLYVGR